MSTYLPQKCGIATYTDYLTRALRKVNPHLGIKIIAEKGAKPLKQNNFQVVTPWHRNEDYVSQILTNTDDIDILHIQHEYGIYGFNFQILPLFENLNPKIKSIITIHCIRPSQIALPERGDIEERLVKKMAQHADRVIVHLENQKRILERLGISHDKISVVPHGTEFADIDKGIARHKLNLPKDKKIILMLGFIKRHKKVHIAIDSLSELLKEDEDIVLFLAGRLPINPREVDVKYFQSLQQKILDFQPRNNIIFPNRFFPNEDVPYLLRAADVVLFPYIEDSRAASGVLHLAIG
ncbi:MAG: glycosyltransferase, partial [Candidatus Hodarchaeota archaeon]